MQMSDKSYRESLHRVVKNHIPDSIIEKGNTDKSWKYGYDSSYDMVIISKDGTIGEIVDINGLYIALPSAPKKIRRSELENQHQKWKRYDVPQELSDFDKLFSDEDNIEAKIREVHAKHKSYIDDDFRKIKMGDWFMCDGKEIYLTGYNYAFLQHYKLSDMRRYPDFREPQRDYFLWIEACLADDRCMGSLYLKNRRSFFSVCSASIVIFKGIRKFNANFPIVSKTEGDAQKLFARHIVSPFNNLPKHLQPQRSGEEAPTKKLHLKAVKKKITTNNKSNKKDDGLDTVYEALASTTDAYDSWQVTMSINDEIGKFKSVNINDYWEDSHKMCHILGSEVVGKALCGSTANAPNKGGKNYMSFYDDSKLSTRDETGQTKTGLYALFITADLMQMGLYDEWGYAVVGNPPEPILNEIGKTITFGAKQFLDSKESACGKNIRKLNGRKRNHPRVDTDAFLDEDASAMFGTEGLVNNKAYLKQAQYTDKFKEKVFRFNLYWENGIPDTKVKMSRDVNGRFQCSWLPIKELRNEIIERDGKKYPTNSHLGAFGNDPYDADRTRFKGSSMMGFVGITRNNTLDLADEDRNKMFLRYNHRPETVEEAEEDVIKALVYFSMPILPETNKKSLVKKLYDRGYRKFVLLNPLKPKSKLSPDDLKYGGISSHATNIPDQQTALQSWIYENIASEIDENNIKVPFIEALEDAELYTRENRQERDATVAWMYAVLATSDKIKPKEPLSSADTAVDFTTLFSIN